MDYGFLKHKVELNVRLISLNMNISYYFKFTLGMFIWMQTLMNVYASVCWLEREIWDMFGIVFKDHIDLRRILTDYGLTGTLYKKAILDLVMRIQGIIY